MFLRVDRPPRLECLTVIWFLRHGEAEDGRPDFERPLTAKGERQSRDAGAVLAALGVKFDLCLASPRVRALDTARLACEQLGIEPVIEERLAGGPFDPVELAAGLGNGLLGGHEPGFSGPVAGLTGGGGGLEKGGAGGGAGGPARGSEEGWVGGGRGGHAEGVAAPEGDEADRYRPGGMSTEPTKISAQGLAELKEELDHLEATRRKEISERIKIARDFGDLKE